VSAAIIPARGGSKRIPRKNVRDFAGRPMIAWPIATALGSGLFERVIVSTDDEEIAEVARAAGAETPFVRPAHLADDFCGTVEVVSHAVGWLREHGWDASTACCIYPTAAFTLADDLVAARDLQSSGWDYVLAAGRFDRPVQRAFVQDGEGAVSLLFPDERGSRSQDLAAAYYDAGQFYWGSTEAWIDRRPILGNRSSFIELPANRALDIDTPEDWRLAERRFDEWKAQAR
jgi:N-acylneuraminate cytidylyltransferase